MAMKEVEWECTLTFRVEVDLPDDVEAEDIAGTDYELAVMNATNYNMADDMPDWEFIAVRESDY